MKRRTLEEEIRARSAAMQRYLAEWSVYLAAHPGSSLPYPEMRAHLAQGEYTVGGIYDGQPYVMRFIFNGSRWVYASSIFKGRRVFLS